jgi:hypothetical protein
MGLHILTGLLLVGVTLTLAGMMAGLRLGASVWAYVPMILILAAFVDLIYFANRKAVHRK